jgi:capsule polysaccharide export protein KpsE/RkpR
LSRLQEENRDQRLQYTELLQTVTNNDQVLQNLYKEILEKHGEIAALRDQILENASNAERQLNAESLNVQINLIKNSLDDFSSRLDTIRSESNSENPLFTVMNDYIENMKKELDAFVLLIDALKRLKGSTVDGGNASNSASLASVAHPDNADPHTA